MSAVAGRMASKVGSAASKVAGKAAESGDKKTGVLQKGAKKDPELYILLAIMSGAFGLAGWHFGRKPTSSSSEQPVSMAKNSSPWQVMSAKGGDEQNANFKYQYHPGGDPNAQPKDAPSALHSVIVPNVNLPKELHDKYNKWGKDGY
ncbi:MAG: hypothetical protein LQ347_000297 [Umbilicaria vellea]|nr:MAG: hypothetical protein LQ347_000297 [Umbilicaria vellea]